MSSILPRHVVLSRGRDTPALRLLLEAYRARDLPVAVVTPARFSGWAAGDQRRHGPPATVLLRLPSGTAEDDLAGLCASALRLETRWIDPPLAVAAVHDKARTLERLAAAGLPIPPTVVIRRDGQDALASLPGERFVVKPIRGASGRGVTVGLDREQALARARAYAELCAPALVQPLLGDGVDRRLVLLGGRLVAAMERVPAIADGRGNTVYGAAPRPWSPGPDERQLALAAAEVMGLSVAAVDLLGCGDEQRVLEVNSCPGLRAIASASGVDLAAAVVDWVAADTPGV